MAFSLEEETKAKILLDPPTEPGELKYATDTDELIYVSEKTGNLIFKKEGNETPAGGNTNQVLSKRSDSDLDYNWRTVYEVPSTGNVGQYLKKTSSSYVWADLPNPPVYIEIPVFGIILYNGDVNTIPENFILCDGNNNTPDLTGGIVPYIMRVT